jgi:hypothetical protein
LNNASSALTRRSLSPDSLEIFSKIGGRSDLSPYVTD